MGSRLLGVTVVFLPQSITKVVTGLPMKVRNARPGAKETEFQLQCLGPLPSPLCIQAEGIVYPLCVGRATVWPQNALMPGVGGLS